jgi:nucleotide-binding universal stress UspA family protein
MASTPFRRILVPHDFSDAADRALEEAAALARLYGGRLHVLHVLTRVTVLADIPVPDPFEFVPQTRDALERRVREVLGAAEPPFSISIRVGEPVERILEAAERVDSIVMGTSGRTGLRHFLLGSVAERIVRLSPVPVLTIRAGKKPPTRRSRRVQRAA